MYSIAYFLRVGEIGSSIYSTYYIHTMYRSAIAYTGGSVKKCNIAGASGTPN